MWKPGKSVPILRESSSLSSDAFGSFLPPSSSSSFGKLPIAAHRRQILYCLEEHRVVVIVGETGCGKSTQVVKYLLEGGWCSNNFQVVCTQPRRLAAVKLAERVASETRTELGATIGYKLRFDDVTSESTKVKFVTDGILVRESLSSPTLDGYSVVIVDEAHERNVNQDVLFGLLKKIRKVRHDLRVVICSATIDAEAFLNFFKKSSNDGVIVSVDGRLHKVETMYLKDPASDYLRKAAETVLDVHETEDYGDVLVFLPTAGDIENCIRLAEVCGVVFFSFLFLCFVFFRVRARDDRPTDR